MIKARGTRWFLWPAPALAGALALTLQSCAPAPSTPTAPPLPSHPGIVSVGENCAQGPAVEAASNNQSLHFLSFAPFHVPETGWETYAPLVAHEIGTACQPWSPAFAHDLKAWQLTHGLAPTGVMDEVTFAAMKLIWDRRRPFVALSLLACPDPPDASRLAAVPPALSYGGSPLLLRPGALAAYERMVVAARAETPEVRADAKMMQLFSAFRSPDADAARCLAQANCQGVVRASCSAHRTGLAMDIYLGSAPGFGPDSAADANRLYISRGAPYRWLVANAGRFGFVNYAFEPWHWEWTGEPI
jgi:hypothetical protein